MLILVLAMRVVLYPDAKPKIGLVKDEGNQAASCHLSFLDKPSPVVQHEDLHAQTYQLQVQKPQHIIIQLTQNTLQMWIFPHN